MVKFSKSNTINNANFCWEYTVPLISDYNFVIFQPPGENDPELKTARKKLETEMQGLVFDLKKFAIHDGPGIRTTVFLKGCPLNCVWCHNPESIDRNPEIFFAPEKCIGCRECVQNCPQHAHSIYENQHIYARDLCTVCGKCTQTCYSGALEIVGRSRTVTQVMDEVLRDRAFYETSGGGFTISGGEPMFQFDFTQALLKAAKLQQLHTCLDTSGFAPLWQYEQLLDFVDIFLYDIKETDAEQHLEWVGVPNTPILKNLVHIDQAGKKIILRCPIVPELNDRDDHFEKIAEIANQLKNLIRVDVLPYHPLGESKKIRLGKVGTLPPGTFPAEETVEQWVAFIQERTHVPIKKG